MRRTAPIGRLALGLVDRVTPSFTERVACAATATPSDARNPTDDEVLQPCLHVSSILR